MTEWTVRHAQLGDVPDLNTLIKASACALSKGHYSEEEIDDLIQFVFGVDSELIHDQTYFVIEKEGAYIACGGWSKRSTLFGSDACETRDNGYSDPTKDAARIRAFFVHPDYSRQGFAKLLIDTCEKAARDAGFKKMKLMSTLPGIKFYSAQGYRGDEKFDYTLPNGRVVQFLPMWKSLE